MKRITAINSDGTTNTSFNGAVGPIHFQNGVVELDTDEHDAYVSYCAVNSQFKVEHEDEQEGDDTPDPDAPFDPAEHTVEEINAYFASLPADDAGAAEHQRVYDAEAAGKARISVTAPPEQPPA